MDKIVQSVIDNINFIRSKSIVTNTNTNTNTNTTATAFSLERIERVWVVALALISKF